MAMSGLPPMLAPSSRRQPAPSITRPRTARARRTCRSVGVPPAPVPRAASISSSTKTAGPAMPGQSRAPLELPIPTSLRMTIPARAQRLPSRSRQSRRRNSRSFPSPSAISTSSSAEEEAMRAAVIACLVLTAVFPTGAARADRGALSIEAGGALAAFRVAAPYSTGSVVGSVSAINLGARYAVANSLELSARVFYEPSTPFYVHGVTTTLGTGSLSAGLITHVRTQGALLGARVLHRNVLRFIASAEAGVSQV